MLNLKIKIAFIVLILLAAAGLPAPAQRKPAETPNFVDFVREKLITEHQIKLSNFCPIETDPVARRIFSEYGAIFVSNSGGKLPDRCFFKDEAEVKTFQTWLDPQTENIGSISITLQRPAMEALLAARREAAQKNLTITPYEGRPTAGSRSFEDTLQTWNSTFFPALDHWKKQKKISDLKYAEMKNSAIIDQVTQVLELEQEKIFFGPDFISSIIFSAAPPGASQHIFLLAFDINEYSKTEVRQILANHGWFQTILLDYPHFTYLGVREDELSSLGLRAVEFGSFRFWIPNGPGR